MIELGNVRLHVVHTPGHTPESITLLISDTTRAEEPWLALTGDTLFVGDIGRSDLGGGEAARRLADDMYCTLFEKLLPLNDNLMIYPGTVRDRCGGSRLERCAPRRWALSGNTMPPCLRVSASSLSTLPLAISLSSPATISGSRP